MPYCFARRVAWVCSLPNIAVIKSIPTTLLTAFIYRKLDSNHSRNIIPPTHSENSMQLRRCVFPYYKNDNSQLKGHTGQFMITRKTSQKKSSKICSTSNICYQYKSFKGRSLIIAFVAWPQTQLYHKGHYPDNVPASRANISNSPNPSSSYSTKARFRCGPQ